MRPANNGTVSHTSHNPPTHKLPGWLPQVIGYAVSAVCLLWVLHGYPIGELLPSIRSLDWRWVMLAIGADLAVFIAQGWRWNVLLGPVIRLRLWRTVQAIYIGLFADQVLPLRTGEVIRCYLLAHWNDMRLSLAFASAAVERLFDGLLMLAAFLLTAGFVRGIPENFLIAVQVFGAFMILGALVLVWVVIHKQEAHTAVAESRWSATLRHILEGLHLMGNRRTMTITGLISLIYLMGQIFSVYALMKAYSLDLSFWVAGGVLAIIRMGTVVPSTPGDLGLFQLATVVALRRFDVETIDAKSFSFIMYFALRIPLLVGGAVATALTGLRIGELHERARRGATAPPKPATEEP